MHARPVLALLATATPILFLAGAARAAPRAHLGWIPTHFPGEPAPEVARAGIGGGGNCQLTYNGGPVISQVQLVAVYWANASSTVTAWAPGFLKAIATGAYVDALSEYNTTGQTNGTGQKIRRGTFHSAVSITPSVTGQTIQDSQIGTELEAQIKAGKIPAPTLDEKGFTNTLYVVFFPPGYTISDQGASSCQQGGFCGYHTSFQYSGNGKSTPYAVIPDQGGSCAQGCGQGTEQDLLGSIVSHEVAESITDEGVGENNLAWVDQSQCNGEIGDLCDPAGGGQGANAGVGTLDGYTMQNEWSNANATCEISNPNIGPQGGCTTNADCTAPTPTCNTTTHTCVGCVTGSDCSGRTPTCDATTSTCRACAANADCPSAAPICASSGACVQCAQNTDCTNPSAPQCDVSTGTCVAGPGTGGGGGGSGSRSGGISGGGSGSSSGGGSDPGGSNGPSGPNGAPGSSGSGGGSGGGWGAGGGGGNGATGDGGGTSGSSGGCAMGGTTSSDFAGIAGALLALVTLARARRERR